MRYVSERGLSPRFEKDAEYGCAQPPEKKDIILSNLRPPDGVDDANHFAVATKLPTESEKQGNAMEYHGSRHHEGGDLLGDHRAVGRVYLLRGGHHAAGWYEDPSGGHHPTAVWISQDFREDYRLL